MSQQINTINNFLRLLCKPNTKLYPDPSIHEFQWSRNLMALYLCLGFLISTTFFSIHYNFSLLFNVTFFLKQCFLLLCFVLLCRTYMWTLNSLGTEFLNILTFESFFFYLCSEPSSGAHYSSSN